jgi:hypothetical protein
MGNSIVQLRDYAKEGNFTELKASITRGSLSVEDINTKDELVSCLCYVMDVINLCVYGIGWLYITDMGSRERPYRYSAVLS